MKRDIKECFKDYVSECTYAARLSPATVENYKRAFGMLVRLIDDLSLDTLTQVTMVEFFKRLDTRSRTVGRDENRQGVKKTTIATYWGKLNSFFEWLRIKKLIEQNPLAGMKRPKMTYTDRRYLTQQEVKKIFNALIAHPSKNPLVQKRDVFFITILLFAGLRREELMSLEPRDFNLDRRILTVRGETSKSGETRHLPIHSNIISAYKDFMHERNRSGYTSPYLAVSGSRDEKLTIDGLKHWVKKLCRLSGVKFHPHRFRHTFAVNFLKKSKNIFELKQLLGHKDIKMTQNYLRCIPTEEMRRDLESLDVDDMM